MNLGKIFRKSYEVSKIGPQVYWFGLRIASQLSLFIIHQTNCVNCLSDFLIMTAP